MDNKDGNTFDTVIAASSRVGLERNVVVTNGTLLEKCIELVPFRSLEILVPKTGKLVVETLTTMLLSDCEEVKFVLPSVDKL